MEVVILLTALNKDKKVFLEKISRAQSDSFVNKVLLLPSCPFLLGFPLLAWRRKLDYFGAVNAHFQAEWIAAVESDCVTKKHLNLGHMRIKLKRWSIRQASKNGEMLRNREAGKLFHLEYYGLAALCDSLRTMMRIWSCWSGSFARKTNFQLKRVKVLMILIEKHS